METFERLQNSEPHLPPQNAGVAVPILTILDRVLADYGRRDFAIRLWDGTTIQPEVARVPLFTLVLNRPGVLRRILLPPSELALAEAYLDGDWDVEGDTIAGMRLGDAFESTAMSPRNWVGLARQVMALPNEKQKEGGDRQSVVESGRQRIDLRGTRHSKKRDRQAVTYHYDVGNDFYRLFLDRRMIYSCGYFPEGQEDLETAQELKLEHICRKLRLKPGERLLDIGCGWGGLIIYAMERFGVEAQGITLSQPQAEMANRRIAAAGLSSQGKAVLLDYRNLAGYGPFDKIASVGMVEHVGRAKLPTYFKAAWQGLKSGGLFLNHGITATARDRVPSGLLGRYLFKKGAFILKYVFPDGELVPVGVNLKSAEQAGFEVRDVESLREHYALTLRHWVQRLEANREEALRQVDDRKYRVWRLYMAAFSHAFSTARVNVHQILLGKPDHRGRCELPMSRADLYT